MDLTVEGPPGARLTFQATLAEQVPAVSFSIEGVMMWSEREDPYYLYGKDGASVRYWPAGGIIWGRPFSLDVLAGEGRVTARIRLIRAAA